MDQKQDIVGQTEATWLLIFDNVDNLDVLEPYWPIFGSGSILLTSRDPEARYFLSDKTATIDVRPFDDIEGATLFRKLAHRPAKLQDEEVTQNISHELGGLPLAIAQIAGFVRHHKLTNHEFLESYQVWQQRSELFEDGIGGRPHLRRGTISATFAFERLSEASKALLEVCAILDPDCVQERLFIEFDARLDLSEHFPRSTLRYYAARAELLRCSLIQRNEENKDFSLHRLVQDAVRARMTPTRLGTLLRKITGLLTQA